jgi:DNA-binding FadR family transcriptional regulator
MPTSSRSSTRRSAADRVADGLRVQIQQRGLKEGDLLATEAEIMAQYGVSRTLAREAVGRLQALGIVVTRQRKGVVVGRVNPVEVLRRSLPFTGRSGEELRQIAQMRYALELGAVELAVRNATESQIRHLQSLEGEYEQAVREDEPTIRITFIDAAFHGLLLEMTGNPLIAGMHCLLEEHFRLWKEERERRISKLPPQTTGYLNERSIWEHHLITSAVVRRDPAQARALLQEHLADWAAPIQSDERPLPEPDAGNLPSDGRTRAG